MGISYSAALHFGIVLPEDYVYEHYDPIGAYLEEDSEWQQYDWPAEALEAHVERLAEGTNLRLVRVGDTYGEQYLYLLVLKKPAIETDGSGDYYKFDPAKLDVGDPAAHQEGIYIANVLGQDWLNAAWTLSWSVG